MVVSTKSFPDDDLSFVPIASIVQSGEDHSFEDPTGSSVPRHRSFGFHETIDTHRVSGRLSMSVEQDWSDYFGGH